MTELRWVLLALGVVLVLAIYLWSRGLPQRWIAPLTGVRNRAGKHTARVEPELGIGRDAEASDPDAADREEARWESEPSGEDKGNAPAPPERVVTIRFVPHDKEIASDRVILALRAAGLKHGKYGIFHRHESELSDEPLFSVASLTEPGSFDLARLSETKIAGTSFFMVLPGVGDPVERFDQMVATAKEIARDLNGELRDEKGSSWSIQRERYVREEIIEYRHLLDRPRRS
jgi:cell division protein ZipA